MTRDCGAWINLLAHQVKKRMNATLSDLGITGVQSRVMHYILEHGQDGPVFQRDVEAAFNLSRSTTTNILQLMEKNGIIRREGVDYDARLKRLVPTEKAVQMEEQVRECARLLEQRITRGLTDEQRAPVFAHGRVHGRKPENKGGPPGAAWQFAKGMLCMYFARAVPVQRRNCDLW